ncbi:MAG TPA: IS110 family transposase [Anaerolineales bacterium]
MMMCYAGIDLHATNSVLVVIDETDRGLYQKRLRNDLSLLLTALEPYRVALNGIAVESTYNWYWLVDGLMDAGYRVHLAHAPALPQYSGLKHADDQHDAQWLAHLLRLGLLPTGYIYPKVERAVRDLLRKRSQLVRHKTMVVLSLQSLLTRLTGTRLSLPRLRPLTPEGVRALVPFSEQVQAVESSLTVVRWLEREIRTIEDRVREAGRTQSGYALLQTVPGIGPILAGTILLEAGDMRRFATVGHFASYCRCVGSEHVSNGKRKGAGNTKNGNKYLSWAFIEAAHFAIRYEAVIRTYYQRKQARTHPLVALKAVAHKLARACYHRLCAQVPFELSRAFG